MLIQKNPMKEGEKIILRLNSNEEVMCEVKSVSDTHVTVTRPYRLIAAKDGGAALAPWTIIGDLDGSFFFSLDKVAGYYNMHPEVEIDYIKATTGIELPR